MSVNEATFINCRFFNNYNSTVFHLYNIDRSGNFGIANSTTLLFDGLIVYNNSADYENLEGYFGSIFTVNSAQPSVNVTFRNCSFKNNTVGKASFALYVSSMYSIRFNSS